MSPCPVWGFPVATGGQCPRAARSCPPARTADLGAGRTSSARLSGQGASRSSNCPTGIGDDRRDLQLNVFPPELWVPRLRPVTVAVGPLAGIPGRGRGGGRTARSRQAATGGTRAIREPRAARPSVTEGRQGCWARLRHGHLSAASQGGEVECVDVSRSTVPVGSGRVVWDPAPRGRESWVRAEALFTTSSTLLGSVATTGRRHVPVDLGASAIGGLLESTCVTVRLRLFVVARA